jgi:thioredoxin reductase (NADPH)
MQLYDVIIIGGGPAGLSAAMTARRAGCTVLMLEKDIVGGGPAIMASIDTYPGIEKIDGWTFTRTMEKQVRKLGVEILESEEVMRVLPLDAGTITVETDTGKKHTAKAVLVATGGAPRELKVAGENRLRGKGVHYCAQCAGSAYTGGTVMVCGNGAPALTAADHLSKLAARVLMVVKEDRLSGDAILAEKLHANDRFQLLPNTAVRRISGDFQVTGVELVALEDGKVRDLAVDGIFIYQGAEPRTSCIAAEKDRLGHVTVDARMQTSIPGIFAAGGAVRPDSRIVIAAGEGALAALSAAAYVTNRSS